MKVLKVDNLEKYYGSKGSITKAVDGVSFEVTKGEFVGIMGDLPLYPAGSVLHSPPPDGRI